MLNMIPSVQESARDRGMTRRDFLNFCSLMTGVLALPRPYSARIEKALQTPARTPVIWLEFQDCAGCTESLLRASRPSVAEIVLDVLSVDYHEPITFRTRWSACAGSRTLQKADLPAHAVRWQPRSDAYFGSGQSFNV